MIITEQDVREEMRDRSAADHLLLTDVAFSSEDIARAMRSAARRFNSILPFSCTMNPAALPGDMQMMFDGIAVSLLENMRLNAGLNDMDYSAGNVTAKVQGNLIANLDAAIKLYGDRFREAASAYKISVNMSQAFGQIG